MIYKRVAVTVLIFAVFLTILPLTAWAVDEPGTHNPAAAATSSTSPASTGSTTVSTQPLNSSRGYEMPHITVNNPAPTPAKWYLHERITWAANLVLIVFAYAGIMIVVSTLRKIEKQSRYAESVATEAVDAIKSTLKSIESLATAATDTAQSALAHAQAIVIAERPWLLITIEPSLTIPNSFMVTVVNRGASPGKIVTARDDLKIVVDEEHLPTTPEYEDKGAITQQSPIILLPGESAVIKTFSRDDLKAICWSREVYRRVESWEEKVFVYGKILYADLVAAPGSQEYETSWCCWYIHGRQKSGLVIAGPASYNLHT